MVSVGHVKIHAGEYVGRPVSPLGNPASHRKNRFALITVGTLAEALAWYEAWLDDQLADPRSAQSYELARLQAIELKCGTVCLLCWCSRTLRQSAWPPECHADIIAARMHAARSG